MKLLDTVVRIVHILSFIVLVPYIICLVPALVLPRLPMRLLMEYHEYTTTYPSEAPSVNAKIWFFLKVLVFALIIYLVSGLYLKKRGYYV